jgi:hypothetical protein
VPSTIGTAIASTPGDPRLRERTVLPVVVVALVITAVVFGGYVLAGALSAPAGPPVDVAGGVRITPLSGWEAAARFTEPPGIRLTRGSGTLDIAVFTSIETDAEALRVYVELFLERGAEQLSVSEPERATLDSGVEGSRVFFVGLFGDVQAPVEGQVTAVASPSGAVVFSGWAPSGLLRYALEDIDTMVARAEIA